LEFYEGLEADNSKAYWQDHKKVYEEAVRAPMEALLAELADEFGEGKIFRPYRDVRFSADKAPYKTAMGATLAAGGYIQLSSDGLGAGAGYYMMASDQLARYRSAVDDDRTGAALVGLTTALARKGIDITAHDAPLKRAPKGYDPDHPRIDLLRRKGVTAWKSWPVAAWLGTKQAKTRVVDFFHTARPLVAWLDEHVGPTELPQERR
jgi:uncharacterized protein (TIGR02453 family)